MLGITNTLVGSSYVSGRYSNFSGSFDGTADFVLLPEVAALKPTSAVSVSLWAKPNAWDMTNGSNSDVMLGCLSTGGFQVYLQNTGSQVTTLKWLLRVTDTGSGSEGYIEANMNTATTEALDGWKHIVGTYDGTTAKLYVNADGSTGITNATSASGASIKYHASNARPIVLGADAAGDTTAENFYHGLLDEVAVFNSALSSSDVTSIFNGGVPNDISGMSNLVGYWKFEEGSGTTVADDSSNSNNGGLGNAWGWSTDTPG